MMTNEIGVMVSLRKDGPAMQAAADFGLKTCQLVSWDQSLWTSDNAAAVRAARDRLGVGISAFWAGVPGPAVWNFVQGPETLGIVPPAYRAERVAALKKGGDFAHAINVPAVITHLGFIPENASDPLFLEVVATVREIAEYLKALDLEFWFETGQETPVTMLRLIEQVGTGNLGINLDPANLILYGKGNPIDALDVFGKYVRNIHAKDGFYPTDPMKLGREVKVGEGRVRFPEFLQRLHHIGFTGELIIEREISGEEQKKDIAETVSWLRRQMAKLS